MDRRHNWLMLIRLCSIRYGLTEYLHAIRAVSLIKSRAYIAKKIALDSNTITLRSFFNLPQLIEVIAVTRFMALCLERTKIVISLRNSIHMSLCLVSV